MKKLQAKPPEKHCPACKGTGNVELAQPTKPTRRIYPAACQQCHGKGRIPAN